MAFRMPPAATASRLKCPAAASTFYDGMDAPTAMCSNCFKKRREHAVDPASAIEAEKAAAETSQARAAAAAAEAIQSEKQRVAAAVAQGEKLAEKEASDRKSAETAAAAAAAAAAANLQSASEAEAAAAAAAAARVRRDSQVQATNEKQLEELAAKRIAEERQRASAAELVAAATARSNIEVAAAASAAATKFCGDVLELNSLLSNAVASAATLRWYPAANRQGVLEAAISSMKQVCNSLENLNAVNGHAPASTSAQSNSVHSHNHGKVLPALPVPSPTPAQPACDAVLPALVLQNADPFQPPPPVSSTAPAPAPAPAPASSAVHVPIASNNTDDAHSAPKRFLTRPPSASAPVHISIVPSSPPPAASLSSIEERPVSFSMKPRRPGAPPSRSAPKAPSTISSSSLSSTQQPIENSEARSAEKSVDEHQVLPAVESPLVQSVHPSPTPAPAKTFAGFVPGTSIIPNAKSSAAPASPPSGMASADSFITADNSSHNSQESHLPDILVDVAHHPPGPSAPSPARVQPDSLAAAAANRRGSLRALSVGDAPQFKPPSSPVALVGLKCPEGEGQYEGMDAPMAVCTKCFKKRRAHLPS